MVQYHVMTSTQARAREYLRVSQDRSGRARSVTEQHQDHQADADRQGWALGVPYADDVSASRYARKARGGFAELILDLENDDLEAEILILWESSRGSRRVGEWVTLIELCEIRQVKIWIHTHGTLYDPANPRHRRGLLEDAVDSEYESAKSSHRILRASQATAQAGRPHGKLLYGYRREYDDRGRYVRQLWHPEQAPIVREAAQRVDAGESCRSIALDLNQRGIAPPRGGPGGWRLEQVKRIVVNPGYAGFRVHRGKVIGPADWPAILDEPLWSRCVARLTDPRRKTVQDAKLKHLLTGTARCGVCSAGLRVGKQRSGTLSYVCYPGFHTAIRKDWLDETMTELVLQRMEREDALELLRPADREQAEATAKRELAELEQRLDGFYAGAAAGDVTRAGLTAIETRLLPQIEDARRRARPTPVPTVLRKLAGPGARGRWPGLGVALQRETVDLLLEIRIMPVTRRGSRRFDPDRIRWSWRHAG